MIGITIAVGILSLIASISTIRRNRRESVHVRLARGAPAQRSVPIGGILPDISALNELVAHASEILNRAEDQGYIDVRILLPPRKA